MPPRRSRPVILAVVLVAATALASQTRLRLERIDAGSIDDGTITVFASVVELEGDVDSGRRNDEFELLADDRSLGRADRAAPFSATNQPIELVLVVETSALYGPPAAPAPPAPVFVPRPPKKPAPKKKRRHPRAPARHHTTAKVPAPSPSPPPPSRDEPLVAVKSALTELVESLNPRYRVLVVEYGGSVKPHTPFRPAPAAAAAIAELDADDESGDLHLADAVRAALKELQKNEIAETPTRRLIVVVSDGLNSQMDRRTFRTLGDAAQKARVPIHSIAFSPTDERGPLLNLGEISKRSGGTFRWARTAGDLKAQIDKLADELNHQYALTFRVKKSAIEHKMLTLRSGDLTSNPFSLDDGVLAVGTRIQWGEWLRWLAYGIAALLAWIVFGALLRLRGPGRVFVLVYSGGRRDGERLVLPSGSIVIGSTTGSLLLTDDPSISSRHAQLNLSRTGAVLLDLGSTNGTFVNDERLATPRALADGDRLRFGNTRFIFRSVEQ